MLLIGANFAEASAEIPWLVAERGLTLIHPFDDDLVIAGQGTVALEMLGARPDLDTLVVAIGGGGLIAGVATVARALHPGLVAGNGPIRELVPGGGARVDDQQRRISLPEAPSGRQSPDDRPLLYRGIRSWSSARQ